MPAKSVGHNDAHAFTFFLKNTAGILIYFPAANICI